MCQSCEVVRINGILCHELGCPDAWKDYPRECGWCGLKYKPEEYNQKFCSSECFCAYHGLPEEEE